MECFQYQSSGKEYVPCVIDVTIRTPINLPTKCRITVHESRNYIRVKVKFWSPSPTEKSGFVKRVKDEEE